MPSKSLFIVLLVLLMFSLSFTPGHAIDPATEQPITQTIIVPSTPLQIGDSNGSRINIPAPEGFLQLDPAFASTPEDFIITFTGDWPLEAQNAFNYAASIWSYLIDPAVPISIDANSSTNCFCGAQGYIFINYYPDMPKPNMLYTRALANHLSGYDRDPANIDFKIYYASSSYDWYYGTDGNPPLNSVDFVTAILHEIGHGLGFVSSFSAGRLYDSNFNFLGYQGSWGSLYNYPYIFDTFVANGAGQSLLDTNLFINPSLGLGAQLTTDQVYFNGPHTRAGNQNLPARLYASIDDHGGNTKPDHLHGSYENTPDSILRDTLNLGEANHSPGSMTMGIFADLGWALSPNLPEFSPIPTQMMLVNTQRPNAVDLWSFIPAWLSPETDFAYLISNTPAPAAGVTLRDNRYIDLLPAPGWLGNTEVTVKATNLQGYSTSQTFSVYIVEEIHLVYLSHIVR